MFSSLFIIFTYFNFQPLKPFPVFFKKNFLFVATAGGFYSAEPYCFGAQYLRGSSNLYFAYLEISRTTAKKNTPSIIFIKNKREEFQWLQSKMRETDRFPSKCGMTHFIIGSCTIDIRFCNKELLDFALRHKKSYLNKLYKL